MLLYRSERKVTKTVFSVVCVLGFECSLIPDNNHVPPQTHTQRPITLLIQVSGFLESLFSSTHIQYSYNWIYFSAVI